MKLPDRVLKSGERTDRKDRYMEESEYWEWYYEEYDPYDPPPRKKSEDLGYNQMDVES